MPILGAAGNIVAVTAGNIVGGTLRIAVLTSCRLTGGSIVAGGSRALRFGPLRETT